MSNCKLCLADCAFSGKDMKKGTCKGYIPMTNSDRVRAMSDEELAEFLERVHNFPCETCCDNLYWCRRNNAMEPVCRNHFIKWLRQPEEDTTC